MTVIISGEQLRTILFGTRVARATAALPQSAAAAIFTVSGGRVLLTGILGEVTTTVQNQTCNTKLVANPTTGSDVDLCATVDIANLEVGGKLSLIPDLDATPFSVALGKQLAGAAPFGLANRAVVVAAGTIDLSCSASNTGSVKWDLTYLPLDAGAAVTAA